MSSFNLFLDALTFPNYKNDNSKKNFRLLFDLEFYNAKRELTKTLISLPEKDEWQWKKESLPYYLPIKTSTDVSVDLDLSVIDNNVNYFSELDKEIAVRDGELRTISVTIMDINDPSFGDHLVKTAKYAIPELLKGVAGGFVPMIGSKVIATISKKYVEEDLSTLLLDQIKASKDKVLFRGGRNAENKNDIVIEGEGVKGKYKVSVKKT